ncbi:MAG TPA: hypothetical protein VN520_30435, partial [Streptomyces sp.]|nr:hypothetical protein [Streptomyces sp.]
MNTADTAAGLESYATPQQRLRFVRAMSQFADQRVPGAPVSVYISVPPELAEAQRWEQWRARIEDGLPDGVRVST